MRMKSGSEVVKSVGYYIKTLVEILRRILSSSVVFDEQKEQLDMGSISSTHWCKGQNALAYCVWPKKMLLNFPNKTVPNSTSS